MYRIGVDLGGTNIAVGVIDENLKIVGRGKRKTNCPRPAAEIMDDIAVAVKMAVEDAGISLDDVADVHLSSLLQAELLQMALGVDAGLLEVTCLGLGQLVLLDILEAQLHGGVAVGLDGLLLGDHAGACFHDGNRDDLAGLIEDLGHAHFLADDCFLHFGFLLF